MISGPGSIDGVPMCIGHQLQLGCTQDVMIDVVLHGPDIYGPQGLLKHDLGLLDEVAVKGGPSARHVPVFIAPTGTCGTSRARGTERVVPV